jgi:hypothetical protein
MGNVRIEKSRSIVNLSEIQMGEICDIIKRIKGECLWLEGCTEWKQAVGPPLQSPTYDSKANYDTKGKGVEVVTKQRVLTSMTQLSSAKKAVVANGDRWSTVVPAPVTRRQTVPVDISISSPGPSTKSISPLSPIIESPSPLSQSIEISEEFNPWAVDIPFPEPDLHPVSNGRLDSVPSVKARPEMARVPTYDSAYYTASSPESDEDTTESRYEQDEPGPFEVLSRSESPSTVIATSKDAKPVTPGMSWDDDIDVDVGPSFRSPYNRSQSPILKEPVDPADNPSEELLVMDTRTKEERPGQVTSPEKGRPPKLDLRTVEHMHSRTIRTVKTAFPNPLPSSSPKKTASSKK